MAAKDIFHSAVVNGLKKEQWHITHDPFRIQAGGVDVSVEIATERVLAAEREDLKIVVAIKSFVGASPMRDFHVAIGQYLNYRLALSYKEPERTLYLAVPQDVYATFFCLQFVQDAVKQNNIHLLVYTIREEVIVAWQT